jgi:hypothetical protein
MKRSHILIYLILIYFISIKTFGISYDQLDLEDPYQISYTTLLDKLKKYYINILYIYYINP